MLRVVASSPVEEWVKQLEELADLVGGKRWGGVALRVDESCWRVHNEGETVHNRFEACQLRRDSGVRRMALEPGAVTLAKRHFSACHSSPRIYISRKRLTCKSPRRATHVCQCRKSLRGKAGSSEGLRYTLRVEACAE